MAAPDSPALEAPALDAPASSAGALAARGIARLAGFTLGYTLLVILFGAVVRITGSGAGCGQHWPTCHGEVAHLPKTTETAIELTHRVTSGLDGLLALALFVTCYAQLGRKHRAFKWAAATLVLMVVEGLIGAALVRFELVAHNASPWRALVIALHLVNTSALMAALLVTAWTLRYPTPSSFRPRGFEWWLLAGMLAVLAVSTSGAVTALGDTLFPASGHGLSQRLAEDQAAGAHFLQRLRGVHPLLAAASAGFLLYLAHAAAERRDTATVQRWARTLSALVLIQTAAGLLNIWLSAPGWMQVLHLGLANLLWLALLLLLLSFLASREANPAAPAYTAANG